MSQLLVKYLAGWIRSENILDNNKLWAASWLESVKKAEDDNMEMVVFRVPKVSNAISEIEELLQEKYGK